ncbi:hypothetical protein HI914_03753 [Erysiphe necator]|nr:hypothetical protein HI914_03753 [Erysiphe necator]
MAQKNAMGQMKYDKGRNSNVENGGPATAWNSGNGSKSGYNERIFNIYSSDELRLNWKVAVG